MALSITEYAGHNEAPAVTRAEDAWDIPPWANPLTSFLRAGIIPNHIIFSDALAKSSCSEIAFWMNSTFLDSRNNLCKGPEAWESMIHVKKMQVIW